jgi:hypothetical protein
MVVVTFLIAAILIYSPEAVYAAVCRLFGYMPGVGIIDESASVRILKQPVSVTRDGVTVTVNRAILTEEKTQIDYDISGVPQSAYADDDHASDCLFFEEYLILPDGTRIGAYSPVPMDVDSATFSLPCIFDTRPNSVPTEWEIPLDFVAVSPEATILPVIDQQMTSPPTSASGESFASNPYALTVDQFIKTDEGYILIGAIRPTTDQDTWMQVTDTIQVKDANNQPVSYSVPEDIQISSDSAKQFPWVLEFSSSGVAFPVTIQTKGNFFTVIDPSLSASIDFDAGDDPQFGQVWKLDQNIDMGQYHINLDSIRAFENGYTFYFTYQNDLGATITMPKVQIEGFSPIGGGGGGGGGRDGQGRGETNLFFKEIPTGKLHITFSDIYIMSDELTWQAQWQPEGNETNE